MVHIIHTAHPKVRSKIAAMVSTDETELLSRRREMSPDPSLSRSLDDSGDRESHSGSSGGTTSDSDESSRTKVAAAAAAVGITYDFGISAVGKACITSLECNTCYFPWGYCRAPGVESVPEPRTNKSVVFEDFFTMGLRMPPPSSSCRDSTKNQSSTAPSDAKHDCADRKIHLGDHLLWRPHDCECCRCLHDAL
jgi:hypothetical protein